MQPMSRHQPTPFDETALAAFRSQMRGEILTPLDPIYDATRVIWNGMIDRRPTLIARCRNAADVAASVRFARTYDLASRSAPEATTSLATRSATAA
jgi:hypothetical protein